MSANIIMDELNDYELEFGFKERKYCSDEESKEFKKLLKNKQPLPDGVYSEKASDGTVFYRIEENDVSDEEKARLLMYQNASNIRTIKKCIVFITGLIVVGLIAGVITALSVLF